MRIPFDSLCLAAVVAELQSYVGGRVQKIVQGEPLTLAIELYHRGTGCLLISADPEAARAHLVTRRPPRPEIVPAFCTDLRRRIDDAILISASQVRFDRVLRLEFSGPEGSFCLVAEFMGKHSNVMLLNAEHRVAAAMKWLGPAKARRPILPNQPYQEPPFEPSPSVLEALAGDELAGREGASPFLLKLLAEQGLPQSLDALKRTVLTASYGGFYAPGHGAYPVSVQALHLAETPKNSYSQAAETHFALWLEQQALNRRRQGLEAQLKRIILAREVALHELNQAADTAARAADLQRRGELILAYQGMIEPGADALHCFDYEGQPCVIPLRPELTGLENAQRLFEKAKRAKAGSGLVHEQLTRIGVDLEALEGSLAKLESARHLDDVDTIEALARKMGWLQRPQVAAKSKEDRPYGGRSVREMLAPGGWRVLFGGNAEANDFLTVHVAKPWDWWLHVRGSPSAHVVIATEKRPEKVPMEAIRFAARVAVEHSPSKHSGYVPVDYTLKRHVWRPKGAAAGTALYTHEKTLHIET